MTYKNGNSSLIRSGNGTEMTEWKIEMRDNLPESLEEIWVLNFTSCQRIKVDQGLKCKDQRVPSHMNSRHKLLKFVRGHFHSILGPLNMLISPTHHLLYLWELQHMDSPCHCHSNQEIYMLRITFRYVYQKSNYSVIKKPFKLCFSNFKFRS